MFLLTLFLLTACGTIRKEIDRVVEDAKTTEYQEAAQVASQDSTGQEYQLMTSLQETVDSSEIRREEAEMIPPDSTQQTIPIQNILDLPDGAKYSTQSGRATSELTKQGDNVIVSAKCDSVARMLRYYERTAFRQRNQIDSLQSELTSANNEIQAYAEKQLADSQNEITETVTETDKPPAGRFWKGLLLGLVMGAGGYELIIRRDVLNKFVKLIKTIV